MKRKSIFILLILLIIISIMGCNQKTPKEPPGILITIGDKEIEYVIGKNKWDGAIFDREDTFQTILRKDSGIEIPFIEIGEIGTIDFKENIPTDLKIWDVLIDENGEKIYNDEVIMDVPIVIQGGKYSFEIEQHMASYLSSLYEEGKSYFRGFRVITAWDENECEYGFVIETGKNVDLDTINSEERQRIDLYVQVMKAAFLEENGGDDFIAVDLESLEGLSVVAKKEALNQLTSILPNVYDIEEVKDDATKFAKDGLGRLMQSIDGTQLWIEIEEYSEEKAIITGVSWFGNLGAVFLKYEANFKDGKWELKLMSMAIS